MNNSVQNSWSLSLPLTECRNLFKEEKTDYIAHFYHCKCGMDEVVVSSEMQEIEYCCEVCDNTIFINGHNAKKSDFYIAGQEIEAYYECIRTDEGFKSIAYIYVPVDTDFIRKKMLFEKHQIAYCNISLDGKIEHETLYLKKNIQMKKTLENMLKDFIIEEYEDARISNLNKKLLDREKKLEAILFFLSHTNLKSFGFFWWEIDRNIRQLCYSQTPITTKDALFYLLNGRKEKSIKRALFEKYEKFLEENNSLKQPISSNTHMFDPKTAFVVCRCFDDPNIVCKLIGQYPEIFEIQNASHPDPMFQMNAETDLSTLIWFIHFLKKHYTEKQIATFLLQVPKEMRTWMDMLGLIPHYKQTIKKEFLKVKLSTTALHDEVVRCSESAMSESIRYLRFNYKSIYKKAAVQYEDLTFKLPYTGKKLSEWAYELHNCMEGYAHAIESQRTVIYGIFVGKRLLGAVEIFNYRIRQCSGKYNAVLDDTTMVVIEQWSKCFFEKKYRQEMSMLPL